VSQRAALVPLTVRSQANKVIAFHQAEPRDLEALADKCGDEFAERVRSLPVHAFETWTPSTEQPVKTAASA
jgi:hypothetical protein